MNVQRHRNRNLTLVDSVEWNGLPLLKRHGPFIHEYLHQSLGVMRRSSDDYGRVFVLRFDLRFPVSMVAVDSASITRFFKSLKAKLDNDQRRRARNGMRSRADVLRYIWAKERNQALHWHYHVALLLNGDAYHHQGYYVRGYQEAEQNMAFRIIGAWASALRLAPASACGLMHLPVNSTYHLNANKESFAQDFAEVFQRISYLAKAETKFFADGSHHFGCSQR